ncbi:uncharacterized protein LOC135196657 [Macrobrachium nipponense]|uniref:uncharacterized protein LOC135196657 n=1 Tax=Macrobrachium nipponense TaxID=159736 RepID=UPI0030C8D0EE
MFVRNKTLQRNLQLPGSTSNAFSPRKEVNHEGSLTVYKAEDNTSQAYLLTTPARERTGLSFASLQVFVLDVMASLRFVVVLLVAFVTLAAVCDALVLCPSFPSCCARRSCGPLCPSCRSQGIQKCVRIRPTGRGRGRGISFIHGDPFAFPGSDIFPNPLVIV